jgi:hypothetical protein
MPLCQGWGTVAAVGCDGGTTMATMMLLVLFVTQDWFLNSLTPIRVRAGTKNSRPVDFLR